MKFFTPLKDHALPLNWKGHAVVGVICSALLSFAAEAGVSRTPTTLLQLEICAQSVAAARGPRVSAAVAFTRVIDDAAREHGVSRELIRAIIQTESEFDPRAVSSHGACGLMQLMPGTVRRFRVANCFDARENVLAGTRFLKVLLTRYEGNLALSIAAYNAGEGAVARHRGIPPYRQTRAYVRRVRALLASVLDGRAGRPLIAT